VDFAPQAPAAVIPAKAGIFLGEGLKKKIPAFAGMTGFRGNDG
jgi:hypothetical protein